MDKKKISNNASAKKLSTQSKNNIDMNSKNIINMNSKDLNSKDTVVDCSASKSNSILPERERKDGPGGE